MPKSNEGINMKGFVAGATGLLLSLAIITGIKYIPEPPTPKRIEAKYAYATRNENFGYANVFQRKDNKIVVNWENSPNVQETYTDFNGDGKLDNYSTDSVNFGARYAFYPKAVKYNVEEFQDNFNKFYKAGRKIYPNHGFEIIGPCTELRSNISSKVDLDLTKRL